VDERIGLEPVDRAGELRDQRGVERIERVRPVDPDDADLAVRLDDEVLLGHVFGPWLCAMASEHGAARQCRLARDIVLAKISILC
jgi:hypothetical protein